MKPYLNREDAEKKYPLLISAMRYIAILNHNEAVGAVVAYANRDYYKGEVICGEAVNHYGGGKKIIQNAFKLRELARRGLGGTLRRPIQVS